MEGSVGSVYAWGDMAQVSVHGLTFFGHAEVIAVRSLTLTFRLADEP